MAHGRKRGGEAQRAMWRNLVWRISDRQENVASALRHMVEEGFKCEWATRPVRGGRPLPKRVCIGSGWGSLRLPPAKGHREQCAGEICNNGAR
jgi:hypothetical protein